MNMNRHYISFLAVVNICTIHFAFHHECCTHNISYLSFSQIVLEYCGGGSLHDLLCKRCQPFSEPEVQLIVAGVLLGLDSLHAKKFAHQVDCNN
jgi:serine/threonine protein kinase